MAAFLKSAIQMARLFPNQCDNKRILSLLHKNLRSISSSVSYLFDKIETDQTHWLEAIKFLKLKLPDSIKNGPTPGTRLMAPDHMNKQHVGSNSRPITSNILNVVQTANTHGYRTSTSTTSLYNAATTNLQSRKNSSSYQSNWRNQTKD